MYLSEGKQYILTANFVVVLLYYQADTLLFMTIHINNTIH
jgi:hypothetical protein